MAELLASERHEIRRLGKLMGWTAFLSFDLIVLGSLVRSTDSGLACPDWPLCYGKLIPEMNMQIFLEWFHRFSALVLGILIIRAVMLIFKSDIIKKTFGTQLYCVLGLFLFQCLLGGLTVLHLLDPKIVSMHLMNAILFLSLLIWIALKSQAIVKLATGKMKTYRVPPFSKKFLAVFLLVLFAQILLGGKVATNHAGVICPDFPKCYGQWFPPSSFLVNLQIYHRFLGYLVLLFAITFSVTHFRLRLPPFGQAAKTLLPILVAIQILLGIANIIFVLPHWSTVSHLGNAVLIFSTVLISYIEISLTSESFTKEYKLKQYDNFGEKAKHVNV